MSSVRRILLVPMIAVLAIIGLVALGQRGAGEVIVWAAAASAWLFIGLYHGLSRGAWARDPIGRHVMAFVGVDALVFTLLALMTVWVWLGLLSWFTWLYVLSVGGIPWTIMWRIMIMWRLFRAPEPANPALVPDGAPAPAVARTVTSMKLPKIAHPLLAWQSLMAGAQTLAGVAYLADIIGARSAAVVVVLVGFAQAATSFYVHGLATTPATPGGTA